MHRTRVEHSRRPQPPGRHVSRTATCAMVAALSLAVAGAAMAKGPVQSPGPAVQSPQPELEPDGPGLVAWSVDGGGGRSAGGSVTLVGSVGQPDAGVHHSGAVTLTGGVWSAAGSSTLFADGFENGSTDRWSATIGNAP